MGRRAPPIRIFAHQGLGQIHLALKRAIRHAETNDLVSRNVAALVPELTLLT
jgi:hypothetical protein